MFRLTAFTSLFTVYKINKSSEFLNTDWFKFSEAYNVTEMFLLELKPCVKSEFIQACHILTLNQEKHN